MDSPARPQRRLIWKYTAVVVTLVAAATISVGLTELYFTSRDIKRAVTRVEQDKASSAAISIEQLTKGLIGSSTRLLSPRSRAETRPRGTERGLPARAGPRSTDQPAELPGCNREGVRAQLSAGARPYTCAVDRSSTPEFVRARADEQYLGRVYFQRRSQPHMKIAVSENAPGRGVVVADVDLSSVSDIIERARVGTTGYAYAVDCARSPLTHPDINLVLRRTSFAMLPQVEPRWSRRCVRRHGDGRSRRERDKGPERLPYRRPSTGACSSRNR